jgi:hypothetical protein
MNTEWVEHDVTVWDSRTHFECGSYCLDDDSSYLLRLRYTLLYTEGDRMTRHPDSLGAC